MTDFVELDPEEARSLTRTRRSATAGWSTSILDAVQRGKVVFVPYDGMESRVVQNRIRSSAGSRRGLRNKAVHTRMAERDGVAGVVVWAEDRT